MTTSLDQNSGSTLLGMQTLSNQVQSLSQLVADDATKLATAVTESIGCSHQALTDQQNSFSRNLRV